ncbi:transposase, partial [Nonomuraea sp. RK-328]|nr:transposase [Nonomuraea sp. RK-328]
VAQVVKRAYKYRFGCVRLVYNKTLAERTRAYTSEGRRVSYAESSAALTAWKKTGEPAFLNEVSSVPLQQALRHLQAAFANFFARRAKYPSFKSRKKSRASAEYTRSAFTWRDGRLTLAKTRQPLDIVWSRPLPEGAQPSTVTVSEDAAGRWFVSVLVEETIRPLPDRRKLARARRTLARKQKGSANRRKAKLKLARIHARITDRRRDFLHKLTTRLVRENQPVVIEDLTVRNMVSGTLQEKMPLAVRAWECACGALHDRDVNAAINILAAGLAER